MAVGGSDELCDEGSCLVCSTMPEPLASKNGKSLIHLCMLI